MAIIDGTPTTPPNHYQLFNEMQELWPCVIREMLGRSSHRDWYIQGSIDQTEWGEGRELLEAELAELDQQVELALWKEAGGN
jgi:hypothetical protein